MKFITLTIAALGAAVFLLVGGGSLVAGGDQARSAAAADESKRRAKVGTGTAHTGDGADPVRPGAINTTPVPGATWRDPVCASQNPNGSYYQVAIIAWPQDKVPNETYATFRIRLANMNGIVYDEAVESGSATGADLVFACDASGFLRIDRVQLPIASDDADWTSITDALKAKGYDKSNEKYVVYYDARGELLAGKCGQGSPKTDERDGVLNANNVGPSYAISYDCDGTTILHELGHALGAVQHGAPHSTGAWHCWDEQDILCYSDGGPNDPVAMGARVKGGCSDHNHFDCRHDDYFDAKVGAGAGGGVGSYIDTHWNLGECYVRWVMNHSCQSYASYTTVFPNATGIDMGSFRGGTAPALAADDDSYFEVGSVRLFPDTPTRITAWYGKFAVPNELAKLKVVYHGKNSMPCSQRIALWKWTTNYWVTLDTHKVGAAEAEIFSSVGGTLADFVSGTSGNGELRVRVLCLADDTSFTASGELLKVMYRTS